MKPLEGYRVVEAAQMISAPMAGMILAEQGADVIKVEMADGVGDRLRLLGTRRGTTSAVFHGINRGKRSITLDTKQSQGLAVLRDLIADADVFIQNFRPGAAERMGIGPDEMCAANPDLIYVSVSGFGPTGPDSDQKVYDYVIQAMTGIAALQTDHEGAPTLTRQFVIDKVTAVTTSQAITAALLHRERGHGGQHLQLAMLDVGLWFFWPDGMMDRALLGEDLTHAPHFSSVYEIRRTSDGYVALVATGNRTWPGLCNAFNPAWLDDPRYASLESREQHAAELSEEFSAAIAQFTTAECLAKMRANDVAGAAVASLDDVPDLPQVVHNGSLVVHDAGPVGLVREPLPPVGWVDSGRTIAGPAPALGEHTDAVLRELGCDDEQIRSLADAGILGPTEGAHP